MNFIVMQFTTLVSTVILFTTKVLIFFTTGAVKPSLKALCSEENTNKQAAITGPAL